MSRSWKRTPITGLAPARSEKQAKREANRKLRRAVRQALRRGAESLPELREVSNVWSFPKDGKRWFGGWAHPDGVHPAWPWAAWRGATRHLERYRRLMRK